MNALFTEIKDSEATNLVGGFLDYTGVFGPDGLPLTDASAEAYGIGNSFGPDGRTTSLTYAYTQAYDTTGVKSTSKSHTYIQYSS